MMMGGEEVALKSSGCEIKTPIHADIRAKDAEFQEEIVRRRSSLEAIRDPWLPIWKDCADHTMPYKGSSINDTPDSTKSGSAKTPKIFDNTATTSARILSSGILSGLTSPTKPWFEVGINNLKLKNNSQVKEWLSELADTIRGILNASNFYDISQLIYEDLTIFGIGCVLIYEDLQDIVRFYHVPVGTYLIGLDSRRDVTILYEDLIMSAYEVVDEFGIENVSERTAQLYKEKGTMEREVEITHVIQKNKDFNPEGEGEERNEYLDLFFEKDQRNGHFLRKKGFAEKPFAVVRWNTIGRQPYGVSPTLDARGDIKQLQQNQKRKGQGIDRTYASPMIADLSLREEGVSLLPNAITFMRPSRSSSLGVDPIFKLNTNFSPIIEDISAIQNRIQKTYYRDLFLMLDSLEGVQPRNQMELIKREGEKLLQLEPMTHRLQKEYLNIVINRTITIADRKKKLPKAPEFMTDADKLSINYISHLATALKAAGTASVEQFFAFVGSLSASNPQILDKVDFDKTVDVYGDALNIPPQIIIDTKKAQKAREERAKETERQQQMESGMLAAQGAKTLSETNVGGGQNALTRVLGI